jgi:hypothetical protein
MAALFLILAHLAADFYLQSDTMVSDKRKYLGKHILHHFVCTAAVLMSTAFIYQNSFNLLHQLLLPLLFITGTHAIIDYGKILLIDREVSSKQGNQSKLAFFILDQLFHIAMIIAACILFLGMAPGNTAQTVLNVFQTNYSPGLLNGMLSAFIILILATTVSGHMIRILLGSLPSQMLTFEGKYGFKNERREKDPLIKGLDQKLWTEEYNYMVFSKHDLSRGVWIGYIERLLVMILTFLSAYPAIGFIVAAKAIARFKQLDDREWAEYFLLGTLSSMFLGLLFGILLRAVLL